MAQEASSYLRRRETRESKTTWLYYASVGSTRPFQLDFFHEFRIFRVRCNHYGRVSMRAKHSDKCEDVPPGTARPSPTAVPINPNQWCSLYRRVRGLDTRSGNMPSHSFLYSLPSSRGSRDSLPTTKRRVPDVQPRNATSGSSMRSLSGS